MFFVEVSDAAVSFSQHAYVLIIIIGCCRVLRFERISGTVLLELRNFVELRKFIIATGKTYLNTRKLHNIEGCHIQQRLCFLEELCVLQPPCRLLALGSTYSRFIFFGPLAHTNVHIRIDKSPRHPQCEVAESSPSVQCGEE